MLIIFKWIPHVHLILQMLGCWNRSAFSKAIFVQAWHELDQENSRWEETAGSWDLSPNFYNMHLVQMHLHKHTPQHIIYKNNRNKWRIVKVNHKCPFASQKVSKWIRILLANCLKGLYFCSKVKHFYLMIFHKNEAKYYSNKTFILLYLCLSSFCYIKSKE